MTSSANKLYLRGVSARMLITIQDQTEKGKIIVLSAPSNSGTSGLIGLTARQLASYLFDLGPETNGKNKVKIIDADNVEGSYDYGEELYKTSTGNHPLENLSNFEKEYAKSFITLSTGIPDDLHTLFIDWANIPFIIKTGSDFTTEVPTFLFLSKLIDKGVNVVFRHFPASLQAKLIERQQNNTDMKFPIPLRRRDGAEFLTYDGGLPEGFENLVDSYFIYGEGNNCSLICPNVSEVVMP